MAHWWEEVGSRASGFGAQKSWELMSACWWVTSGLGPGAAGGPEKPMAAGLLGRSLPLPNLLLDCLCQHQHPYGKILMFSQFSSVAQSCPSLCDPMNHSMPGLPVHHQLPEFTQTHVHWVGDAIQPSHPLLSPSPPAPNPSQHQGLFQWVNSSHEAAKVLEFQL